MPLTIPDDQLIHGLNGPCLIDDPRTSGIDVQLLVKRADEWARILRQQQFHLGITGLFQDHPALVAIQINAEAADRQAKLSLFATPRVEDPDPKAQKKALRAVETSLGQLRGQVGSARTDISTVLHNMVNQGPFSLTRDTVEDYLRIALGPDLYQVRHRWLEDRALRATLDEASATPPALARPRL